MKLTYKCNECGKEILTNTGLAKHLSDVHRINLESYYKKYIAKEDEGKCLNCGKPTTFIDLKNGYHKFCSAKCRTDWNYKNAEPFSIECKICGHTITALQKNLCVNKFSWHLKTHNITSKDYYDKYLKKPDEGFCVNCGKPTSYQNFIVGYAKNCSGICAACAVRDREFKEEKEFQEKQQEIKKTKEEEYKNILQELKDRVHQFDWEGERNTWAGGNKPVYINTKDNLITDNSMTYIDGQEFSSNMQTITENEKSDYNDHFWL